MGKYRYCVITRAPSVAEGKGGGNLAHVSLAMPPKFPESDLFLEFESQNSGRPLTIKDLERIGRGRLMSPVFEAGEIVILDRPGGREVAGVQRKPSKWGVEYEEFTSLDRAVKKAKEVLEKEWKI